MGSEGGGSVVATAPTTDRRLPSQQSTLRDTFIVSDHVDGLTTADQASNQTSQRPVSNVTLDDVLNGNKKSHRHHHNLVVRTLVETRNNCEGSHNRKKSWKCFKEKLKCKKGNGESQNVDSCRRSSSMPVLQADELAGPRSGRDMMANRDSRRSSLVNNSITRVDTVVPADDLSLMKVDSGETAMGGGALRLSAALSSEREQTRRRLSRELAEEEVNLMGLVHMDDEEHGEEEPTFGTKGNQPLRVSLMDLIEETDRQAGVSGTKYLLGDDGEDQEEEEEVEMEKETGKREYSCCVCMVRHKGAAFIPCGHTFCRLCSRELFVQRGNCPLCNNYISEILDIF
ncbi:hypothetical protein vseg_003913 [Gypsophila vaccaria]